MGYKTAISDLWNFQNFGNLEIFKHFLFMQKKKFTFSKNGIYVLEEPLKNVCTKFQVIPFMNIVFIAFWMWKMATFQGIWT